jgi:hypothetical protein
MLLNTKWAKVKNNNRKIMQVLQLIKIHKSKNHNKEHSRCCTVFFSCFLPVHKMHLSSTSKTNFWLPTLSLSFCFLSLQIFYFVSPLSCVLFICSLCVFFVSLFCLTADIRHLRRFVRDDHFFFSYKQNKRIVL